VSGKEKEIVADCGFIKSYALVIGQALRGDFEGSILGFPGVYGPSNESLTEGSATNPINPYSAGKLAVEELLKYQALWCGWTVTVMRSFNAAGSDPEALIRPTVAASITWRLMDVALGKTDKFVVFGPRT
jgi:UDP-glucose 4-epimerase